MRQIVVKWNNGARTMVIPLRIRKEHRPVQLRAKEPVILRAEIQDGVRMFTFDENGTIRHYAL